MKILIFILLFLNSCVTHCINEKNENIPRSLFSKTSNAVSSIEVYNGSVKINNGDIITDSIDSFSSKNYSFSIKNISAKSVNSPVFTGSNSLIYLKKDTKSFNSNVSLNSSTSFGLTVTSPLYEDSLLYNINIKTDSETFAFSIKLTVNKKNAYDRTFSLEWSKASSESSVSGCTARYSGASIVDEDKNFYTVGQSDCSLNGTNLNTNSSSMAFLVKYDTDGNKLWTKTFDGTAVTLGSARATGIIYDYTNQNIIISIVSSHDTFLGITKPTSGTYLYLIKMDKDGNIIKTANYGASGVSFGSNTFLYFNQFEEKALYVSSSVTNSIDGIAVTGVSDLYFAKFDLDLNRTWTKLLGVSTKITSGKSITSSLIGEIYVTGNTTGNLDGQIRSGIQDCFTIKYDLNGSRIWTKLLGTAAATCTGSSISTLNDNNVYVLSSIDKSINGQTISGVMNSVYYKYDSSGNLQWTRLLGNGGATYPFPYTPITSAAYILNSVLSIGVSTVGLDGKTMTGTTAGFFASYDTDGNRYTSNTQVLSSGNINGFTSLYFFGNEMFITGFTNSAYSGMTVSGGQDYIIHKFNIK